MNVDPKLIRRMEWFACSAGILALVVGCSTLIGWAFDISAMRTVLPGLATMKVNTALGLMSAGGALFIHVRPVGVLCRRMADVLSLIAIAIGTFTLIEWFTGYNLGIDEFFFTDTTNPKHGFGGRMSHATATCLVLLGSAMFLIDRVTRFSQVLAGATFLISAVGLLGYAYGVGSLYAAWPFSTMALHTAFLCCLLSLGHLMARPRRCVHRLLTSNSPGGMAARRLLPVIVIVPAAMGAVLLAGQRAGWYEPALGAAIASTGTVLILAVLLWWNAWIMDATDAERRHAEHDRDELLAREQSARHMAEGAVMARDQLLSVVSHELRTPLTPVLLVASALERHEELPVHMVDDLQMIREQIQLEVRLIDDLLDLVSLAQGKLSLELKPNDFRQIVTRMTDMYHRLCQEKGVSLVVEPSNGPIHVLADAQRLQQITRNLLDNALKFTPSGGTITVKMEQATDGMASLTVSDTGVGIKPDALARIFGAFEQGDPSMTRRFGGLGIGLAITRQLVEMHHGRITARSEGLNRGAQFTLLVPMCAVGDSVEVIADSGPAQPRLLKLLIVEDNIQTSKALGQLLRARGHQVALAGSAREARELMGTIAFDLLISDIGLPDESGWELMRKLREQMSIRGIAISGFVEDGDRKRSLESGFHDHLAKPVEFHRLLAAISAATDDLDRPS